MNDHCGYHFPLHFSPEFHDFHHLKSVPETSNHSNSPSQHIQITKISQLNRIKTRFLSSKQVSHQLWLVWHLGLDPWHRRQIWQIHHTQVTFFILQWCLRGKPCYAMQFSRLSYFHLRLRSRLRHFRLMSGKAAREHFPDVKQEWFMIRLLQHFDLKIL